MAQNNEAVREFTFEEYISQYKNDAEKLFSEENEGCDTPFANFIVRCGLRIIQLANETINRQKAEIERLEKENSILSINADTAFQDGLNEAVDLYAEEVKEQVKVEAVKEFSKLLIDKTNGGKISSTDIVDFTVDYLRGESNGKL